MKKLFFAASLLILAASCNTATSPACQAEQSQTACANGVCDLAYVNVERVLAESDIFTKEGNPLQQRTESARRDWAQKEQNLQSEMAQLQKKYQDGLITSTNAQREQANIEKRAQEFQTAVQKQATALDEENAVFANRAQKLVMDAVRSINKDKKYKMIVNATALIDADSTLDISNVVLEELNKLYINEKK